MHYSGPTRALKRVSFARDKQSAAQRNFRADISMYTVTRDVSIGSKNKELSVIDGQREMKINVFIHFEAVSAGFSLSSISKRLVLSPVLD